ncbi:efflux RND transporter permease subunit [Apibacter raozihei]|uniref:efflux RND transporter permease subunit n=1 Tax=Apibacter raozihei TaxID=2500547 RepID=UPI000FE40F1B|nr:efflux RND transporter permease subunit [Apibacter raozihei]
MNSFLKFFLERSSLTLLIVLGILALGWTTLNNMPRSEDPEIKYAYYVIVTAMPGAMPNEIQERIVKPIEDRFYELEDVKEIKAQIWSDIAVTTIEYKYGVDGDSKYQEVVREMEIVRNQKLPNNAYILSIEHFKNSDVNIFQLALQSKGADYKELEKYAVKLKDVLRTVEGLKNIKTHGYPEQEIRVELDINKIANYHIPVSQIINYLKRESFNISAGNVVSGNSVFSVKAGNKYQSVEQIANTIVYTKNKTNLKLKDIATVKRTYKEEDHIIRLNGLQSALVTASLKEGYNIVSVADEAKDKISSFEKNLPDTIKLETNFDQSSSVEKRLKQLGGDFIIALFLVIITLLPLGFRSTLVVIISIPLSLAIALVALNLLGYNLNQLSIVGLIISLGILVDDSIVVNENIERTVRSGLPLKKAILTSTHQISFAVIGVTATLIIAFMPIVFLPEGTGEFIRSLPMAVILAVSASLFVSLAIVPFLSSKILTDKTNPQGNIFLRAVKKGIDLTYSKIIRISLKYPVRAALSVMLITLLGFSVVPMMGFSLFPKSDKPQFYMEIETTPNSSLEYTNLKAKEVEKALATEKDIQYFTTNVGKGNPRVYYNVNPMQTMNNYAEIFVQCYEDISVEEKTEIIKRLRKKLENVSDSKIRIKEYEQGPALEAPTAIRLYGENIDTLQAYSVKIEDIIKKVEGTNYVQNPILITKTGLQIIINKEKAALLGVNPTNIDLAVQMAIAGIDAGEIELEYVENKSGIRLTLPRNKQQTAEVFDKIYIQSDTGESIPFQSVATIVFEKTPSTLTRINKEQYTLITASAIEGYLYDNINNEIIEKLNTLDLPNGYRWSAAGEKENQQRAFNGFGIVLIISFIAFISALILEFKNFKSILIVLSVIPLGIMGGIWALFITGHPLSFISMVGFIALIGIEIKNSILLVDYTHYLRKEEKMSVTDAVAHAGEVRFIPIFLTTMTAVAGMIPLVIQYSPLYSPLALVIIGGLISSLLLSRILTPVLYKLLSPALEKE